MLIRDYSRHDAEGLNALIVRTRFGSDAADAHFTADTIHETLRERCAEVTLVAVDDDRVVGALAMLRGSGRRVAPPGELYADIYLIDPQYRNSRAGGDLFAAAYLRILKRGVRTLRTEVSPANPAFALYTRVGFRCLPGALPDQRGYIEMVSHLPGVIIDVGAVHREVRENPPSFRALDGRRGAGPSSGVELIDDRWVVHYEAQLVTGLLQATVDFVTNETVAVGVSSGTSITNAEAVPAPSSRELWRASFMSGRWIVTVDESGTLRVESADGIPALIEQWPVARGVDPPGWRNATARRAADRDEPTVGEPRVTATETAEGVYLVSRLDGISRTLSVHDNTLEVRTRADRDLISSPWVRLRNAVWRVASHGEWYAGPVRQGLWPPSATDFEPAVRPAFQDDRDKRIDAVGVSSAAGGFVARWRGAEARLEGMHLPQLLINGESEATWALSGIPEGDAIRCAASPGAQYLEEVAWPTTESANGVPVSWDVADDYGTRQALVVDSALTLAPGGALAQWRQNQSEVLASPWPSTRTLDPLVDWHAGLWVSALPARLDPTIGSAWAGPDTAMPWSDDRVEGSWSCSVTGTHGIRVTATARSTESGDTAIFLTPAVDEDADLLVRAEGRTWRLLGAHRRWEGGFEAVAVSLADGRQLVIEPRQDNRAPSCEVFVRAGHGPMLIACLGRADSPLHVDFQIRPIVRVSDHRSGSSGPPSIEAMTRG
ncbi:N-acetyltransferase family protein [Microbacterium paulum]